MQPTYEKVTLSDDGVVTFETERVTANDLTNADTPVRAGHLEYPTPERRPELQKWAAETALRHALESLTVTLANPGQAPRPR